MSQPFASVQSFGPAPLPYTSLGMRRHERNTNVAVIIIMQHLCYWSFIHIIFTSSPFPSLPTNHSLALHAAISLSITLKLF